MKSFDWIVTHASRHSQAIGLDLLCLDDTPTMTWLWVATPDHTLWRNTVGHTLALGFHPHRADVTMIRVSGDVLNVWPSFTPTPVAMPCHQYQYEANPERFVRTSMAPAMVTPEYEIVTTLRLPARALHTVFVRKGETASWLTIEEQDDPGYRAVYLSNEDLTRLDWAALYHPMPPDLVTQYLATLPTKLPLR